MNRVTSRTPLEEILNLMHKDGYVLMEDALTPEQLKDISAAYDKQLQKNPVKPGAIRNEIKRILEKDPVFEQLMDLPTTFPVARAMIGADIELASGGELDLKYGPSPAYIGWHNDFQWMTDVAYPRQNFWIRTTYFIEDVTEDMGPFTLLPCTHLADRACPREYNDENGRPKKIEGQIGITGKAGSCLINNTEIWHTNTANLIDKERRLIMILYKHSWMKQWQDGYEMSSEFANRQTTPLRRQLCGKEKWHQDKSGFPAANYFAQVGNLSEKRDDYV